VYRQRLGQGGSSIGPDHRASTAGSVLAPRGLLAVALVCALACAFVAANTAGASPSVAPLPPPARPGLATAAAQAPRLGRPSRPGQAGYGEVRPSRIFNGGDPTGIVDRIQWTGWGSSQAIGAGDAEYVWPGTAVADNGIVPGARVVAFHLGRCRGRPSYNALEWYFPKYGQSFNPKQYIDTCTGNYVGAEPPATACPDVRLADGAGTATEVKAIDMSCASARAIIAETNTTPYVAKGGRFLQAGFRCGTEGSVGGLPDALFDCQMGEEEFLWEVAG
jgi:hypothetical protein